MWRERWRPDPWARKLRLCPYCHSARLWKFLLARDRASRRNASPRCTSLRLGPCEIMRLVSTFVTSDRIALTADANRMFLREDAWAIPARVNLRELRSQKADQRRVIDPETARPRANRPLQTRSPSQFFRGKYRLRIFLR